MLTLACSPSLYSVKTSSFKHKELPLTWCFCSQLEDKKSRHLGKRKERMRIVEIGECQDYSLFHLYLVIVGAELKDNYFGSSVIFTAMHTVILKMFCKTTGCCVAYD